MIGIFYLCLVRLFGPGLLMRTPGLGKRSTSVKSIVTIDFAWPSKLLVMMLYHRKTVLEMRSDHLVNRQEQIESTGSK